MGEVLRRCFGALSRWRPGWAAGLRSRARLLGGAGRLGCLPRRGLARLGWARPCRRHLVLRRSSWWRPLRRLVRWRRLRAGALASRPRRSGSGI
ncbi:hypothetical protein [Saccharopolyspora rectivirgula]|uniref:hypothetical protein n=1 Tax=Saccharopolyspora rectivirgula TaxID=28042 RepID=UPI0004A2E598|nr:hypothetical protein [Saccharopolyspora rectivirgula]